MPGKQMDTGIILIMEDAPERQAPTKVAAYARVSSAENKSNLDSQAERLIAYYAARGYPVAKVVKEVGSGINDSRPKFLALLADQSMGTLVVEHQERATRFGFRYIETLLKTLEVVNRAENSTEDMLADLTAIIYSLCARLYGQRRAKRQTEKIVQELEAEHAVS